MIIVLTYVGEGRGVLLDRRGKWALVVNFRPVGMMQGEQASIRHLQVGKSRGWRSGLGVLLRSLPVGLGSSSLESWEVGRHRSHPHSMMMLFLFRRLLLASTPTLCLLETSQRS